VAGITEGLICAKVAPAISAPLAKTVRKKLPTQGFMIGSL
jgi:hypothetical protein